MCAPAPNLFGFFHLTKGLLACPRCAMPLAAFISPDLCGVCDRLTAGNSERIVMHVDMDCFFASVAMREDPSLVGKPIAVSHSDAKGEVSACSYEAKACGVKAGMFVEEARKLCPDLVSVPYQFALYESTSRTLFGILQRYTGRIQVLSCEEAFLDVTELRHVAGQSLDELTTADRALHIATLLRADIQRECGCTASVGISDNLLIARMATEKAKPNGLHLVAPSQRLDFMRNLAVDELPGVGWSTRKLMQQMDPPVKVSLLQRMCVNVRCGSSPSLLMDCGQTCLDLLEVPESTLRAMFGDKKGAKLRQYAQGHCDKEVVVQGHRKSISLDVNTGIRFDEPGELLSFLEACVEQCAR